jgi:Transposase DDE domain
VSADVVAIDGKTLRGSSHKKGGKAAIHMVSAFAARQRLVLGQVKVADKSNEIVAIPALLDMLAIEGAVITIDAMGCQHAIAQKVLDKKADYILALKGNQRCARMSSCLRPSRRQTASGTPRSPGMRPSMAITAASRPEPMR